MGFFTDLTNCAIDTFAGNESSFDQHLNIMNLNTQADIRQDELQDQLDHQQQLEDIFRITNRRY